MKKINMDLKVNNRGLIIGLLIFFLVIVFSGLSASFPAIMFIFGILFGGVLIVGGIHFYIHNTESSIRILTFIVVAFGILVVFFSTVMLLGSVAYITTTSSIEPYQGRPP